MFVPDVTDRAWSGAQRRVLRRQRARAAEGLVGVATGLDRTDFYVAMQLACEMKRSATRLLVPSWPWRATPATLLRQLATTTRWLASNHYDRAWRRAARRSSASRGRLARRKWFLTAAQPSASEVAALAAAG